MSGGIIEGLKKCFTEKDAMSKHIFLLILTFIMTLPSVIAVTKSNLTETEIQRYIYIEHSYLGIIFLIGNFIFGLFVLHFMHNSIKHFTIEDTQPENDKFKTLTILPNLGKEFFAHIGKCVGFGIIWIFSIAITLCLLVSLTTLFSTKSVFIACFGYIAIFIYVLTLFVSFPFIAISFSKNYQIKGNISPLLLFKYFPIVINPVILLSLKILAMNILLYIITLILIVIIAIIYGAVVTSGAKPSSNFLIMSSITTTIAYLTTIIGLTYYYAAAKIYYDKIEKKSE